MKPTVHYDINSDLRYLNLLSQSFPSVAAASTEIINLEAILNLPKGTEHFLADLHGEYQAFRHILKNASGNIKRKVNELFGSEIRESEKKELCTLIYYPEEKLELVKASDEDIADAVHIPVIVYNVPSRTGVDIPVSVYQSLARIPNIAGVKEASGEITKIARIRAQCPEEFAVWSGNDDQAAAVMALGGSGVISVVSNVLPEQTLSMARAALDGDFDTAADLQIRLLPLIEALFSEVNPIPVKAAMKLIGYDCGECRLPLTPISQENLKKLKTILLPS